MKKQMFRAISVLAIVIMAVFIGLAISQAADKPDLQTQVQQAQARGNQALLDIQVAQRQLQEDARQVRDHQNALDDGLKRFQAAQAEVQGLQKKIEADKRPEPAKVPAKPEGGKP